MKKLYIGELSNYGPTSSDYCCLFLNNELFLEKIQEDIEKYGNLVTVRYGFSKEPIEDIDNLFLEVLEQMEISATIEHYYSEISGYVFSDEDLKIGGHDLLATIYSCIRLGYQFMALEITFHGEEEDD